MTYTVPTPSTVNAGDTFPASTYNAIIADIQDHESRIAAFGVPTGTIVPYVAVTVPNANWLLCNGAQVSQATYSALYAIIGPNKFGTDTAGNFYLPDLQGRVPVGLGTNVDVDVIGDNDGAALASRRPKHLHTASSSASSTASVSETSTGAQTYDYSINQYAAGSGSGFRLKADSQSGGYGGGTIGTANAHTHSVGVSVSTTVTPIVGPQTNAPTDGPAFLTLNFIIKT